jgi:hypothetical protein
MEQQLNQSIIYFISATKHYFLRNIMLAEPLVNIIITDSRGLARLTAGIGAVPVV